MSQDIITTESQLKTFWSRPEGKMGAGLLVAAGALGIYAWGTISSFLVGMLVDTVHIAMLAGLLFVMGWVAFSKRSHMLFRLLSRALTGLIIEIDPVGIAEDKIRQMKKRREEFATQITAVSGQKRFLEDTIAQNKKDAATNLKFAAEAKKQAAAADAQKALQMQFQVRAKANKAGRLDQANIGYQQLLGKINMIYDLLCRWATNIDFFIEDTEDSVKQAKMQYKVTNAAFSAIKKGMAIIKGDVDENEVYDRAMEFLAQDASEKLGAIDDFQRAAQPFMNSMDLQNGVVDADALKQLDQYEQKLLTSGDKTTAFLLPGATSTPVPEGAPITTKRVSEYKDLLK